MSECDEIAHQEGGRGTEIPTTNLPGVYSLCERRPGFELADGSLEVTEDGQFRLLIRHGTWLWRPATAAPLGHAAVGPPRWNHQERAMNRITGAILVTAIIIATGYTVWTGALYLSTLIAWAVQ